MSPINIEVTEEATSAINARDEARQKLGELEGSAKGPILGTRVVLIREANPRISMPTRA